MWGELIRRYGKIGNLEHILSLLSCYVPCRNFSKHSECFERILGAKPSALSDLRYQNTPKTDLGCVLNHLHSYYVESISHTQIRTKVITKIIPDNAIGLI